MPELAKPIPIRPPKQEPQTAKWDFGVDRKRVGVYVGVALIGGFALGFATARYLAGGPPRTEQTQAAAAEANSAPSAPVEPSAAQPATVFHKVLRVIRADTVELEGVGPVRLIGVETPDGKAPQKIYEVHGRNALAFTEKSLLGQPVRLEYDPLTAARDNKDTSGQTVAYIYEPSGLLFNTELIRQGHAFVRSSDTFRLIEEFRSAEREAMQAMRGVWGLGDSGASLASIPPLTSPYSSQENKPRRLTPLLPSEIEPRSESTPATLSSDSIVFLSPSDKVYHKDGCEFLPKRRQAAPLSRAKSEGYTACGRCFASTVLKANE